MHRSGEENLHAADALTRQPVLSASPDDDTSKEVQIAHISSDESI